MSPWLFLVFSGGVGLGDLSFHSTETWQQSLNSTGEFDSTAYSRQVTSTNQYFESGRVSLDYRLKHSDDFRFKFTPLFQADPLNESVSERYWSELPEAYFQYQVSGFRFQAGYNTFTWGVTDGYNPLDVVSAKRYQDPLKQEKLGAPSLNLKKEIDHVSFEVIYIPEQRRAILPGEHSRWLPRQVLTTTSIGDGTQSAVLNLPPALNYHYGPERELDQALKNNFGARIQVNGMLEGLDLSIEGFEGSSGTPALDIGASGNVTSLRPRLVIQADPDVTLSPVYYRARVYGGSVVYAVAGMILKSEIAVTRLISRGPELLGNSEEFIAGVERPVSVGSHDLTLVLQGTYGKHSVPMSNAATSFNRVFDQAWLLGVHYPFSEKITVLVTALLDTQFHEQLAHLEGSYSLTDAWKLGIEGDGLWGSAETPLGTYNNNKRAIITAKVSF